MTCYMECILAALKKSNIESIRLISFDFLLGDWITIWVHFNKYMNQQIANEENSTLTDTNTESFSKNGSLLYFICTAALGSYTIYFSIGGFLHVRTFC